MNASIPAWVGGALDCLPEIDVHRRGFRHPAVAVFVTRGARVLIRQRPPAAYLVPSLWSSAGHAHPECNEATDACALRLMRVAVPDAGTPLMRGVVEYRATLAGGFVEHERVEVFGVRLAPDPASPEPPPPPPGPEADVLARRTRAALPDAIWIDIEDLLAEVDRRAERFSPWLQVALSEHLSLVLG